MLNIEKYKDTILNSRVSDITCCVNGLSNRDCNKIECEVCKQHAMEWLLEEAKETCYQMMIASQVTDDNIQSAEDVIKDSVDYIFEKLKESD